MSVKFDQLNSVKSGVSFSIRTGSPLFALFTQRKLYDPFSSTIHNSLATINPL